MELEEIESEIVEIFADLSLLDVDSSWIDQCFDGGFCEFYGLPSCLENEAKERKYYTDHLSKLVDALNRWLIKDGRPTDKNKDSSCGDIGDDGFWTALLDHNLSHKAIIAVLASFIGLSDKGCRPSHKLLSSVFSARAYIHLVCIPGSQAYKIFHSTLFEKAVDILKLWPQQDVDVAGTKKRKLDKDGKSGQSKTGRKKRQRRKAPIGSESDEDEDSDVHEDMNVEDKEQSYGDLVAMVYNSIFSLSEDILLLIEIFSLKRSKEACHHLIQAFALFTRLNDQGHKTRFNGIGEIHKVAFKGLEGLCTEFHGDRSQISRKICEFLMPNLMMKTGDKGTAFYSGAIPKSAHNLKNRTLGFIYQLCKCKDSTVSSSIRVLLQHMASTVPERAEYRGPIAETMCNILKHLPGIEQQRTIEWLQKLSKNSKITSRIVALETISHLLEMSTEEILVATANTTSQPNGTTEENLANNTQNSSGALESTECGAQMKRVLLQTIISRCSDKAPTVRAKALSCVQLACNSRDNNLLEAVKVALFSTVGDLGVTPVIDETGEVSQRECDPLKSTIIATIRKRVKDSKVLVRKSAVQSLESAIKINPVGLEKADVNILHERCMDEALSVRKQAIVSLTEVLKAVSDNTMLQSAWLDGVLPRIIDKETTVQEKSALLLEEVILQNIVHSEKSKEPCHSRAWDLLNIISGENGQELSQYLSKVCELWSKNGKFSTSLVKNLLSHMDSRNAKAAWLLLAEIAGHFNKIDPNFVIKYWREYSGGQDGDFMTISRVLKVIASLAEKLSTNQRLEILDDLKGKICGFACSPEIISAGVTCISQLSKASGLSEGSLKEWCESVMLICEKNISDSVLGTESGTSVDDSLAARSLFTLGEVAQLCPTKTSERMFLMVQSFLFSNKRNGQDGNGNVLPLQRKLSSVVKAHSFVTLGKLCLQNEDLAKKCIAAIAHELEFSECPVSRNNIIVVMCDLCVRYTNLVDRYVPNIASCLKDPDPVVRRQTLTLLTHLLSEDFVKWRGSLFFKFVMAVVDDNEEIRKFTEFCLVNLLLTRHPNMFSHHFIECIFYFNSYEKHKVYNQFLKSEKEKNFFSLKGDANYRKRQHLYKFLLNNMNDEQKFNVTGKLCHEVLGCVIDGDMEIDQESGQIIRDVLALLGCKEIKLSSLKTRPADPEEEIGNEQQMAVQVAATARAKIITQVVKKNMIENIIPIIVALKHELEKRRSPLLKYLMRCLKEIVKDYKNEVQDVLAADRQLANEIEFDIKKFEERQKELESKYEKDRPCVALGQSPLFSPGGRGGITTTEGTKFQTPRLKARNNEGSETPCRRISEASYVLRQARSAVVERVRQPLLTAAIINSAKKAMHSRRQSVNVPRSDAEVAPVEMNKDLPEMNGHAVVSVPDEVADVQMSDMTSTSSNESKVPTNKHETLAKTPEAPTNGPEAPEAPTNGPEAPEISTNGAETPKNGIEVPANVSEVPRNSQNVPSRPIPVIHQQLASQSDVSEAAAESGKTGLRHNGSIQNGDHVTRASKSSTYQNSGVEPTHDRIASTPQGDRSNIGQVTFMADLSIISKTPIHASVKTKTRRNTRGVKKEVSDNLENQVICLPSPTQASPKPKVWSIQSPLKEANTDSGKVKIVNKSRTTRRRKK